MYLAYVTTDPGFDQGFEGFGVDWEFQGLVGFKISLDADFFYFFQIPTLGSDVTHLAIAFKYRLGIDDKKKLTYLLGIAINCYR